MDNEITSEGGVPLNLVDTFSGEETTSESAAETKEESTTDPAQEGETNTPDDSNVPFHEHPRFKELVEQKNSYADQIKELKELVGKTNEKSSSIEKALAALAKSEDGELDPSYVKLMGDDEPAKEYFKFMQDMIEKGVESKLSAKEQAALQAKEQEQQQRAEWENIIDAQIKEISSEGTPVDREQLLNFAKEHSTGGMLMDLRIAHKLMTKMNGDAVESAKKEKKQNAGMVSSQNNSSPATADKTVSIKDMRNKSWGDWRSFTKD